MKFWKKSERKKIRLSVVVIFHDMCREAERTLFTLSSSYQQGVADEEYEVIAIDNGSKQPLDASRVSELGSNFKYVFFETMSSSPAGAINFGVGKSKSDFIAVIVDGARMVTPGIIAESMRALQAFANPFVCALGWHLGPDVQNLSILTGYSQAEEDRLLESIDWRNSGYCLFDISTLAQSSSMGFFGGMPKECSWFAMQRSFFHQIGGYDERFQQPGGGLVNHDFLGRVLTQPETNSIVILGEGSFHQIHGGVATNVTLDEHPWDSFKSEYHQIHDKSFEPRPITPTYYLGQLHASARKFMVNN